MIDTSENILIDTSNDDKCTCCGEYLDEFSEYGVCFTCIMNSSIIGQYQELIS